MSGCAAVDVDPPGSEPPCQVVQCSGDVAPRVGRRGTLGPHAPHGQDLALAVEDRLDPADQLGAAEDGQDVVAVPALRGRDVHLEAVPEAEELRGAFAVVHEPVERRQQHRPAGSGAALEDVTVRPPLALEAADPRRHCDAFADERPKRLVGVRWRPVEGPPELVATRDAEPFEPAPDDRASDVPPAPARLVARQPP